MIVLAMIVFAASAWVWGYIYREDIVQRNRVAYWLVTVIVLLGIAVFAAGCATTEPGYREQVRGLVHTDANELIRRWGAPAASVAMPNGHTLLVYRDEGAPVAMGPAMLPGPYCETRVEVDRAGVIRGVTVDGHC